MAPAPLNSSTGELRREFTFRSTFSLAFAFISPIIGLYTIFALALGTAGPSFWLGFSIVLAGQFLVALVLGELASRWPKTGGLYKWTQALAGPTAGWAAGWAYVWTLIVLITAQCYAAAPFFTSLVGIEAPSSAGLIAIAGAVLMVATLVNILGPKALKVFVALSITAELIGSVVIGTVLLLFFREQPVSAIFDGVDGGSAAFGPLVASVALIGWSFIGFESAGDIAEEVKDPERAVPKALIGSLLVVAVIVMYAALGLILAVPDLGAAVAGGVADPIAGTITAALGAGVAKPLFAMVVLAFLAGIAAVQASVARVIFALARDRALPGARALGQLSGEDRLPRNAIYASAIGAAAFLPIAFSENAYATLLAMATVGFYISFAFPVFASLIAHTRHMHACRQTFLAEALAHGLDKRDLGHNVNFFMNVPVTPEGGLTFEDGLSAPGRYVELRADVDTRVMVSNCPQLNNPCNAYDPTPVRMLVWDPPA